MGDVQMDNLEDLDLQVDDDISQEAGQEQGNPPDMEAAAARDTKDDKDRSVDDVYSTNNPLEYAINSNFFVGLVWCPKVIRNSQNVLSEWWWRMTTSLVALTTSFWVTYLMYYPHRVFLEDVNLLYSQWEFIPLNSSYRNPDLYACWRQPDCVPRNLYCSLSLQSSFCDELVQDPAAADYNTLFWCEADCSPASDVHGVCGCLPDHGNMSDYTTPEKGSCSYEPPNPKPSPQTFECVSHES
jgi:hypothetical protein